MSNIFKEMDIQPAVKKETKRVALVTAGGVVFMWIVFGVFHGVNPESIPFDYTVILGGLVGGLVAVLNFFLFFYGALLRLIPKKPSNSTINFRKASRKIRQEEQNRLYHHKCAVCGRTDTEYPGLEFRYCSRCAGYHCFCADHINNHIHFTE